MSPITLEEPSGRYLSLTERVEIHAGRTAGHSVRRIARELGRSPSTVSREIHRNTRTRPARGPEPYKPMLAQRRADHYAQRPKTAKLAMPGNEALREMVQKKLKARWSPQQISHWLGKAFPDDPEMRVSTETIYQAIYVQSRGALKRELHTYLRTGRGLRHPRRRAAARNERIKDKVMISDRPAEVTDRLVPGHYEGDLIVGADSGSAIGTLVERTTRFTMLLHLPYRHGAAEVHDALIDAISGLPEHLRRSLTWDQGIEMSRHAQITLATDMQIYFCDPHSPWQRGTNENTNGLLRQYFPKGTDLSVHTAAHLQAVAAELNGRPRKTLDWQTPAEAFNALLLANEPTK